MYSCIIWFVLVFPIVWVSNISKVVGDSAPVRHCPNDGHSSSVGQTACLADQPLRLCFGGPIEYSSAGFRTH